VEKDEQASARIGKIRVPGAKLDSAQPFGGRVSQRKQKKASRRRLFQGHRRNNRGNGAPKKQKKDLEWQQNEDAGDEAPPKIVRSK